MEMKFCQSCGMPLTNEVLGTNADGSPNEDYCIYCYKDGKFTQDMTMEHLITQRIENRYNWIWLNIKNTNDLAN